MALYTISTKVEFQHVDEQIHFEIMVKADTRKQARMLVIDLIETIAKAKAMYIKKNNDQDATEEN